MTAAAQQTQAKTTGFTPRKLYFVLAIAEACTWTALIMGLIFKANSAIEPNLLTVIGGIHGFVFITYGATAILVAINNRWHFGVGLLAVIGTVIIGTLLGLVAGYRGGLIDSVLGRVAEVFFALPLLEPKK